MNQEIEKKKWQYADRDSRYDKSINDVIGMEVYTNWGEYFGVVEEAIIGRKNIEGWRIRATEGSFVGAVYGVGMKGVTIPYSLVESVGEFMVIKRAVVPRINNEEQSSS